jgi:hypothetical protein
MEKISKQVENAIKEAIQLEINGKNFSQRDSLTHSGFWLDSAEFQMDGKF